MREAVDSRGSIPKILNELWVSRGVSIVDMSIFFEVNSELVVAWRDGLIRPGQKGSRLVRNLATLSNLTIDILVEGSFYDFMTTNHGALGGIAPMHILDNRGEVEEFIVNLYISVRL